NKQAGDEACGNSESAAGKKGAHFVQPALDTFLDGVFRNPVITSDFGNRAFVVESREDAYLLFRRQSEDGFGQKQSCPGDFISFSRFARLCAGCLVMRASGDFFNRIARDELRGPNKPTWQGDFSGELAGLASKDKKHCLSDVLGEMRVASRTCRGGDDQPI